MDRSWADARMKREQHPRRLRERCSGHALYKQWIIPVFIIKPPRRPEALRDIVPLLGRLRRAFGTRSVALLLNVRSQDVRNWRKRRTSIPREMRVRILDLHDVFTRLFRLYHPQAAFHWLTGPDRLLGGRRPVDVVTSQGAAPITAALGAIEAGCRQHVDEGHSL